MSNVKDGLAHGRNLKTNNSAQTELNHHDRSLLTAINPFEMRIEGISATSQPEARQNDFSA